MIPKLDTAPERQVEGGSLTEPPVLPTDEEQAHAKKLLAEVDAVLESKGWKDYVKDIDLNRLYTQGKQNEDNSGELVRANLIHPEIMSLVSTVYAKDPEISVSPTEAVTPEKYKQVKAFGKTLELVIKSQFAPAQANLKKYAKAAIRSSATAFIGWMKVVYQKDYEQDPQIANRIKDIQDNLERVEHLIKSIDKDGENGDQPIQAQKQELEQMLAALQSEPEVVRSEGLVFDKPMTEDVLFSLDVMDSTDIHQANWITQRIWMTVDKCVQRFGFCPSKGSRFAQDRSKNEHKVEKDIELVCVYEMWHQTNSRVYTLLDGWHGYMRDPFTPSKVGERFNGFFPLIYDPVDGEPFPLCLAGQLRTMQDEHIETRTNFRHHRKHSVPMWIGLEGKVTQKDARKIRDAESMEVVLIEGDEGSPIRNYLDQFQNPVIDPNVYTTEHIREDWERVTRRGDAARGSVSEAKTATEANILQQGLQVASTEMQDTTEDWLREIAQYSAELLLQEMSYQQVQKIAGQEATWPQMTKEQIFDMVSLNIRAGSSGKPDKFREQEQWIKFLPELRESLMAINDMEANGSSDRAEILRKLVEETLRRFDERIDIDEYFPKDGDDEGQQQQQQAMQQQLQQVMQELEQLKASKQSEQQANQLDAQVRVQEAERKLEESALKKESTAIKAQADITAAQSQAGQSQADSALKQVELQIKQEELLLKQSELEYKAAESDSKLAEARIKHETMMAKSESDIQLAGMKSSQESKEGEDGDVSAAIQDIASEVKEIKEIAEAANEPKRKSVTMKVNGKTYTAKIDYDGSVAMDAGGKTYSGNIEEA